MADVAAALAQEPGIEPVMFNPLRFGGNAIRSAVAAALALPGRAMQAAGDLQRTGDQYDPAPAVDAALMTMGGTVFGAPKGAVGAGPPIRAYHGSPHDFDRFDMSKIGSGEGAQAYGHGLYFAENEGVARSYKGAGLGRDLSGPEFFANSAIKQYGEPERAVAALLEREQRGPGQGYADAADLISKGWRPSGKMYEVNINAAPEQFLDWDKPLAAQGQNVRQFFEGRPSEAPVYPDTPGQHLSGFISPNRRIASETMNEAGIPGIKYLDQGSRMIGGVNKLGDNYFVKGSSTPYKTMAEAEEASRAAGNATSNYVVFNDKLIDILRKYQIAGIAPPAALLAAAQQQGGGEQQ